MTHANRLLRVPTTFRQLTGLTPAAFQRLLGNVTAAAERTRLRRAKRPGRGPQRRRLRIAAVSPVFPGSVHDKKVFDRARVVIPAGAAGYGDTAYLGTGLKTPRRKPAKGVLTPRQKAGNRRIGRKRV